MNLMNKEFRNKNPETAKRFIRLAKTPFYGTLFTFGLFGTVGMLAITWYQDRHLLPAAGSWLLFVLGFSLIWAYLYTYAKLVDQETAYVMRVFGEYREIAETEYGVLHREYTELWRHIRRDGRDATDEDLEVARSRKPDRILIKKALDAAQRNFPGDYIPGTVVWDMEELSRYKFGSQ